MSGPVQKAVRGCMLAVVLVVFLLSGCTPQSVSSHKLVYIPILADASWLFADGAFISGVELAVEELNNAYAERGFVFKTEVIDDQASYEEGVKNAAQVAANPEVTAVLNLQNFDVTKTTADMLAEAGKVVFFPYGAYDSLFTRDNPFLFCGVPSFADLGEAMARYVLQMGYKRIAIYYNGVQSQEELVTALELSLLGSECKVVDYVSSIISPSQFTAIDARWRALGVEAVVIAQYGLDPAFKVLEIIRGANRELAVIGEPIFNRAIALAKYKDIAEGMVVPSTLVLEESERLAAFRKRYREKYGHEPDTWAVQGYDLVRLIADTSVQLDTTDPARLAEAFHAEEGYQGVGRLIRFEKGGALVVDVSKLPMLTCRDGQFL
ncbi:MAG TPA: ABC transporter substrate-binding protein [Limnochordia bacterium]|nr:ABC transporter substrate-binding protein [Limnochordia bacterium]